MPRPNCSRYELTAPTSDIPLPGKAIERFLRHVRHETDVIAIRIANELLDDGETIETIVAAEHGFRMSVVSYGDGEYDFHVSCIVGSGRDVVGDGGTWLVAFDAEWNVMKVLSGDRICYD